MALGIPLIASAAMMARLRWFLVFLLLLGPGGLGAVEIVDGPRVEATGTTATVRWKLDAPAGGMVRFGRNAEALTRGEKSDEVAAEHEVRLDRLSPGTRYFYSVGTARRVLQEGSFVAGGGASAAASDGPEIPEKPAAKADGGDREPAKPAGSRPSTEKAPAAKTPAAQGAGAAATALPARRTWANVATLRDHYERHGRDFASPSAEEYAAQAWRFLERAKAEGLPAKLDPEGTLRVWDPKTRSFAAYTREGLTKTYFKPGSPDYFERQPGRPVRLKPAAAGDRP